MSQSRVRGPLAALLVCLAWSVADSRVAGRDDAPASPPSRDTSVTAPPPPQNQVAPRAALLKPSRRTAQRRTNPSAAAGVLGDNVLAPAEVDAIVKKALSTIDNPNMTVAVVDRPGNILALYRDSAAAPGLNDDVAVGLARTAALFSNSRAPLSSRTVRFISGKNFPNGVAGTPSGALYGIENTNRGCELNVAFNPGMAFPPSKSVEGLRPPGLPCNFSSQAGCGLGIVTGKFSYVDPVPLAELLDVNPAAVNPGGIPIYRVGASQAEDRLLGGVGVAGIPAEHAEFAAFMGATGNGSTSPVFQFPLPSPGNVFIDGVRLPFIKQATRPAGTTSRTAPGDSGYDPDFDPVDDPKPGTPAPTGYLVGPLADPLAASARPMSRRSSQRPSPRPTPRGPRSGSPWVSAPA